MKFLIVFVALFAVALARPSDVKQNNVEIVKLESDVQPDHYIFAAETSDGTRRDEEGVLTDAGSDDESLAVHGSYSWKDEKTGQVFTVVYVADKNGFQPIGDHIPKVEGQTVKDN